MAAEIRDAAQQRDPGALRDDHREGGVEGRQQRSADRPRGGRVADDHQEQGEQHRGRGSKGELATSHATEELGLHVRTGDILIAAVLAIEAIDAESKRKTTQSEHHPTETLETRSKEVSKITHREGDSASQMEAGAPWGLCVDSCDIR